MPLAPHPCRCKAKGKAWVGKSEGAPVLFSVRWMIIPLSGRAGPGSSWQVFCSGPPQSSEDRGVGARHSGVQQRAGRHCPSQRRAEELEPQSGRCCSLTDGSLAKEVRGEGGLCTKLGDHKGCWSLSRKHQEWGGQKAGKPQCRGAACLPQSYPSPLLKSWVRPLHSDDTHLSSKPTVPSLAFRILLGDHLAQPSLYRQGN